MTVALLPFENLTGDADQEYFADGLTEETIAVLGKVNPNRMIVIARTSTMAYKGGTKTASQIGYELGADYLLEGSVRREGERVRVTVKLIRVRDQSRIWGENYDRIGSGVIQIQDELGNAIARQIQVELLPGDTNPRKQTRILDAYDPYLLGRHYWSQVTPGAIRKSIEYYQTAIAKDPSYTLAFAGLSDAYTILSVTSDVPPREMRPLAGNAAADAIRLDDSLAEAQAAGGYVDFWLEWNWARAEERLRRAIELESEQCLSAPVLRAPAFQFRPPHRSYRADYQGSSVGSRCRHSRTLWRVSSYIMRDDIRKQSRHSTRLSPFIPISGSPTSSGGKSTNESGQPKAAIQSFEKAYGASGGNTVALSVKGYVLARSGRRAEAEQIVHGLIRNQEKPLCPTVQYCARLRGLGDRESALQWLDKGYEARDVRDAVFAG